MAIKLLNWTILINSLIREIDTAFRMSKISVHPVAPFSKKIGFVPHHFYDKQGQETAAFTTTTAAVTTTVVTAAATTIISVVSFFYDDSPVTTYTMHIEMFRDQNRKREPDK